MQPVTFVGTDEVADEVADRAEPEVKDSVRTGAEAARPPLFFGGISMLSVLCGSESCSPSSSLAFSQEWKVKPHRGKQRKPWKKYVGELFEVLGLREEELLDDTKKGQCLSSLFFVECE